MFPELVSKLNDNVDQHFWIFDSFIGTASKGFSYRGSLYVPGINSMVKKNFFLRSSKLYYIRKGGLNRLVKTDLSWKILRVFYESNGEKERFGFSLLSEKMCEDFYAKDEASLEEWVSQLEKHAVLEDIFDDYEFGELIGQGGSGKVYFAKQKETSQPVAIKVISEEVINNSKALACLRSEIKIMRKLNHPNIVNLIRVYETNSKLYLVMEYIPGKTLLKTLTENGPFTEDNAIAFSKQFLKTLSYLHQKGIIHRDIKPENIVIDSSNFKLIDFGISESEKSNSVSQSGSLGYLAPEIITNSSYSCKADLYSLGVVLYFLLSRKRPFRGVSKQEFLAESSRVDYTFLASKGVSGRAIAFISKLLEKNPQHRLSAEEALEEAWLN